MLGGPTGQDKAIKEEAYGYFTRGCVTQILDVRNHERHGWLAFLTIGVIVGVVWTAKARAFTR